MSNIKFRIIDKYRIELLEDANRGDIIDLSNAYQIDLSIITDQINKQKDLVYLEKLEKEKQNWELLKTTQLEKIKSDLKEQNDEEFKKTTTLISQLQITNKSLSEKLENSKKEFQKELDNNKKIWETNSDKNIQEIKNELLEKNKKDFEQLISQKIKLESDIKLLQDQLNNQKQLIELQLENKYNKSLNEQKTNLENKIKQLENNLTQNKHQLENKDLIYKNELNELTNTKDNEINKLQKELEFIKREKSTKNIKLIGEELENYCLNQFNEASMFAFKTSTLIKDNVVIKNEDELKGTKGDFIFKVYAEEEKQNLLLSVMCEMKSEQLNSHNKKKNSDHYKKLDDDRNKKNLDYALLVSELESETNDSLIYRVNDYKDMFVIRPMYFISFLGVLETIALKYKDLKLNKLQQEIMFKEKQDILNEFEEFKNNLLDNALKHIDTKVNEINKSAENIKKEANKILEATELVINKHLNTVKNKINNFKIEKVLES
ncbi:DUF2130 domain-containing protein [Mycoplasma mycoides]|uniref:DUF2130 domain-containing protein n=1 Tax=Mycoplasma mycoides TaxID=2102 RepID=UPI000347183A|nr:DUF2130 domain-containing protein [Mycoplasma mycoides]EXU60603.1 hypothetical protein MMC_2100 [Mycoplasma mycoides subsp. capri PG3]QVK04692.1 DUF2130 domain-containing protein [Mycoplasma mycoides subsp. capri]